jgi:DNA polymerase-3 subunit gamma/tau
MHIALARKYRPAVFEDMAGQEAVAQALKNAVLTNRVAHAYIFAGPRGVGKTSAARILAKTLNCPNTKDATACNSCDICRAISLGSDLDVVEIDGASHRTVEEIRPIIENIHYQPTRAKYRIYIIDEVHMLSRHAFNSLLKTLEEPPPFVIFIFATTEPDNIPETVRSRCQYFDFLPLNEIDILKRLSYIAKNENIKVEPGLLRRIARFAKGSMRDAISLLDQLVAYAGNEPKVEALERLVGVPSASIVGSLLSALVDGKVEEIADKIQKTLQKNNPEAVADELLLFTRDALMFRILKQREVLLAFTENEVEPLAKVDTAALTALFANLLEVRNRMRYTTHPALLLEIALLRLAQPERVLDLFKLLEKVKEGKPFTTQMPTDEKPITSKKTEEVQKTTRGSFSERRDEFFKPETTEETSPEPKASIKREEEIVIENSSWQEVRQKIASEVRSQFTRNILNSSVLKGVDGTSVTLGVHPGYINSMKGNIQIIQIQRDIEDALKKVTGKTIGVRLVAEESLRKKAEPQTENDRKIMSPELYKNVQQVKRLFGAVLEGVRDVSELRRTDEAGEGNPTENAETAE